MKYSPRKKSGSYPTFGVIVSITLALFVVGLFGLLMLYSQELGRVIRENVKLQVYLQSGLGEPQRKQIESKLLAMSFVAGGSSDKKQIDYISKEDAAKKFIQETGEDFMHFVGENPLKDAYLVRVDPAYHTKEKMDKIKNEIEAMAGVFQVFYVQELVESVNKAIQKIALLLVGTIIVLLMAVVFMINNTMRIALFSQRFLIRSMQLVGARSWFIQRPFLFSAAYFGFVGGVVAVGLLYGTLRYAQSEIDDLILLHNLGDFLLMAGLLIIIGILISTISSYFSIRKYLRLSLDELF